MSNLATLIPGNRGHRGGSGRPPDWLKEKCRKLVNKKKLVERLAKIAAGELVDTTTTSEGRFIPIPAPMQAQVKATQELLDRGWGKSVQTLANDQENPLPGICFLPSQTEGKSGGIKTS